MNVPLFLLGPILILLKQLVLLAELVDEAIEFLIIYFYSFEFEDLVFERVDDDFFLVAFCLSEVVGSVGSLSVVQVFAVHFV